MEMLGEAFHKGREVQALAEVKADALDEGAVLGKQALLQGVLQKPDQVGNLVDGFFEIAGGAQLDRLLGGVQVAVSGQ